MVSRSAHDQIFSTSFRLVVAGLTVALSGCSGPYIRSQQGVYAPEVVEYASPMATDCGKGTDCWQACSDGQLKLGLPRPILHAIAGPFIPREIADPYQSAAHAPHSKFHPVPTRPVFAPLATGPLSPNGSGFMGSLGPTPAAPLSGSPVVAPQADGIPRTRVDGSDGNQPEGTGVSPRLLPSQTPAELIPPPEDEPSVGAAHRPRWGEMPTEPAIRAASAEARFVEL